MKKQLFLLLFFFVKLVANGQEGFKCYIVLSFNDCVNCIQPIRMFDKISSSLEPTLVFREFDKRSARTYLQKKMSVSIPENQIIFSDSLFLALNKGKNASESYVHITFKNHIVQSFRLTSFHVDSLHKFVNIKIKYGKKIPDTLILGSRKSIFNSKNRYFIFDEQFQKIYSFDKKTNQILSIVSDSDFSQEVLYKQIFGDTVGFFERVASKKKILEAVDKTKPELVFFQVTQNQRVFLKIRLFYVSNISGSKNMQVLPRDILVEWINMTHFVYYPEIISSKEFTDNRYFLFEPLAFDVYENNIYTGIIKDNPDSLKTKILAKFNIIESSKKDKNNIKFEEFLKIGYPSFAQKTNTLYAIVGGVLLYPYYFYRFDNLIVNLTSGETAKPLQGEIRRFSKEDIENSKPAPYFVSDVINLDKDKCRILLFVEDTIKIIDFNKKNKNATLFREIKLPNNQLLNISTQIIFSDINKLVFFGTDNFIELDF
ncbi:MAG: hypothetical protein OHK0045_10330 [Raineya sp.]